MEGEDATYRLYADIFPRLADSFSEQAKSSLTVAMAPVQQRMDDIAKDMGDTAGLEFGRAFRSRVDDAIRLSSGTIRIRLDLDTSAVYAKLEALRSAAQLDALVPSSSSSDLAAIQAKSDAALAAIQARDDATRGQIQARSDASLSAISAKNDATLGQIQAKDDVTQSQIKAKDDATRGQISAKSDAALAAIQARDEAASGQIKARSEATLEQIRARNDAALAEIKARSDASNASSSGSGGIFSNTGQAQLIAAGVALSVGALSGAALAAIPVAIAAIGAAAVHTNSEVSSAFSGMTTTAKQTLSQGFQPLIPVFAEIAASASNSIHQLEPVFEQASRAAAPLITTISQGFIQATVIGVTGFANALKGLQPVADALAQGMIGLSKAVSGFLSQLNVSVAAQGLKLLFDAIDSLFPVLAQLINAVAPLSNALLRLVPVISDLIHGALDIIAPVATVAANAVDALATILDHFATPLGALVPIALGLWGAFKVGQGVVAGYNIVTSLAETLTKGLGGAMDATVASSAAEVTGLEAVTAAEAEATAGATAFDVAASPMILALGAIAAAAGAVVVGVVQMKDQFTSFFNDPTTSKVLGEILNPGSSSAPNPGFLGPLTSFLSSSTLKNALSAATTAGQPNIDTANLLQTDLTNRITLTKAAADATQAYSDAQYQLGTSDRAVEASTRAEAAAVRGVADAQDNVRQALQAVSDAQQKLSDDETTAREDTLALTEARKQAAQTLIDLRLQLTDQAASQKSAQLALFDAQQAAKAAGIDISHGPVGLPTGQITAQNETQQKAQLALVQAQNAYNDSINTGNKLQDTAADAFAKGINESTQVVAAQKALSSANRTVAADFRSVQTAQQGVSKAQQALVDAKQAVVDSIQSHSDALHAEQAQARAVQQAYIDMSKAQAAATITTDLNTQAGRDNFKQAQDLIASDVKLGLNSQELTQKFADQESQLGLTSAQIFATAQQTGSFSDNQLAQLAQQLNLTNTQTENLQINLDGTKVRLGDLNGIKVNFDVNGVGTIDLNSLYASLGYNAGQIQQIQQQAAQPGGPPQGSANALLHAAGGPIYGPGGPTDDRVPAWLSNGEHVWTADEVSKAGGHSAVEHLRRLIRGYASGGAVTPQDALAAAGVVAAGFSKGVAADAAVGAASALFNASPIFFPDHHLTTLVVKPPVVASGSVLKGSIPSGQHKALIDAALAADHIPAGQWSQWEIGMDTLVTRESGWNPAAINLTDSNARAGHPSQGLAQTIPSTFAAYRNPGLPNNILDPVANLAAAINYIVADYHGIGNVQQANPSLPPKGYDKGGWLTGLGINTSGMPEAVLTHEESQGLKAAVQNKPIRLDSYSIAQLAQAIVMANQERPINVQVGQSSGLGVFL